VVADSSAQTVKLSSPIKRTFDLDYKSGTELGGIAQMWQKMELSTAMIWYQTRTII
jgi:hypothetical protein